MPTLVAQIPLPTILPHSKAYRSTNTQQINQIRFKKKAQTRFDSTVTADSPTQHSLAKNQKTPRPNYVPSIGTLNSQILLFSLVYMK